MTRSASSRPAEWCSGCGPRSAATALPGIELAHNVRSPEDVGTLLADAERAGDTIVRRQHRLTGAEQQERSPTPTATCGKWPATPAGPSTKTAQYTSDPRAGPI